MNTTPEEKLIKILNRLTLESIQDKVLNEFPGLTWETVIKKLNKNNENLTKANVLRVLRSYLKKLNNLEIEEQIINVKLLVTATAKNKTWYTFCMKDESTLSADITTEEIKLNINRAFKKENYNSNINAIVIGDKYVISIEKQIKRLNTFAYLSPSYFLFFKNEPYIFASKKSVDKKALLTLIEGLGFSSYKYCNLYGPNVEDLLILLHNKEAGTNFMIKNPDMTPQIHYREYGIDYSQCTKRQEYATTVLGENPPQLQRFAITVKEDEWHQMDDVSGMECTSLTNMTMTLRSHNVINFLKEMIANGIIATPIPDHLSAILNCSKNQIKISN